MNLPNKLTLSRIFAVVIVAVLYFVFKDATWNLYLLLGVYVLASITDFLDGHIARKYNMVTGFGKLMDPLADKMIVIAIVVILMDMGLIPYVWLLLIIVGRELMVSGIRLIALEQQSSNVIAADLAGKAKTMTQMVSTVMLCLYAALSKTITGEVYVWGNILTDCTNLFLRILYIASISLFFVSMVLLVISGTEIFVKNRKFFQIK